jgi:CheY-like chemotaxis protein
MIVLCIDNDPEDIEFFFEAIKHLDPAITCLSAEGGESALALLYSIKDVKHLPDYIFLDVNMPRMNGKDVLREIRKDSRYRSLQVVMLSTGLTPRDFQDYKQLGADLFLSKATAFQGLCDKLKTILIK